MNSAARQLRGTRVMVGSESCRVVKVDGLWTYVKLDSGERCYVLTDSLRIAAQGN